MELASDITPEDLQVFLQEAEEHLQLLDEDFIRLEREQDNQDLLQEIFRAAHTLKGSSAMLGHERMTALAPPTAPGPKVIDMGNDAYRGTIEVVDRSGRVVRTMIRQ